MEDEQDLDEAAPEPQGGRMKYVLLGGGLLVVLAIGILAGPVVQNLLGGEDAALADDEPAPQPKPGDAPELYQGLHPALVVNFRDAQGEPHYMQLELEVMARDQKVVNAVREHTPLIRNNLILLYGNVKYEEVVTREGKEKMLAETLAEIQKLMGARVGDPNVEAVYFTSLIIQ